MVMEITVFNHICSTCRRAWGHLNCSLKSTMVNRCPNCFVSKVNNTDWAYAVTNWAYADEVQKLEGADLGVEMDGVW